MSYTSKQGLTVQNGISFPNNNSGQITPQALRDFNNQMIESLVDEITYVAFTASVTSSINNLNAFSASQQPTFNALNSFTASQLTLNTGYNNATGSLQTQINNTNVNVGQLQTWSGSVNEIASAGIPLGYSTRFYFSGLMTASIVQNVNGPIAAISLLSDTTRVGTASFEAYTASVNSSLTNLNAFTASQENKDVTLASVTASLNAYTASNNEKWTTLGGVTGSFARTGSNTFTGDQTLIDNAGNFFTITDTSGSMMLVAKGFTSASAHLSASASGNLNLIFKTSDVTADTSISGSGNIFSNPNANATGFKRYVGGNNNIFSGVTSVPNITGSMAFSPAMSTNYLAGIMNMRGPVSSSTYSITQNNILGTFNIGSSAALNAEKLTSGLSFSSNYVAGTFNIIANQAALTGSTTQVTGNNVNGAIQLTLSSSALIFVNNTINDNGFIFTNQYYSQSVGLGQSTVSRNTIAGTGNQIIISGSIATGTTNQPNVNDNIIGGASNIVYVDTANARVSGSLSYNNANRSIIYGQALIVSASSFLSDLSSQGSAFFGRYNVNDNIRNKTSDTIFAVGTGNTTTRKTGFLIDSGSNTFVEGTLNVSGSTTVTGSVLGNVVALSIASNTASMDLSRGNFFTLTLVSGSTTQLAASNIKAGQTINLLVTQAAAGSGSLSYNSTFKFTPGNQYTASVSSSAKDIMTFITFDNSTIYASAIKNLV